MAQEWYYNDGQAEPHGPFTWEELKGHADSGRINLHALVWSESDTEQKRPWTVQQVMAAICSETQFQDDESYNRLDADDVGELDSWDGVIEFDDFGDEGDDAVFGPDDAEFECKLSSAPTIGPRKAIVGHEAGVTCLAFQPGSKPMILASGSFDGTARLWDFKREKMLACLRGHGDTIEVVAFSPTQPLLASASRDGTVRLWNLAGNERRSVVWGHGTPATALAFSPDGKVIVTGCYDGTIRWWDIATGMQTRCVESRAPVESLCLSPDGATIISTHAPKLFRLWDFASGEQIRTVGSTGRSVTGCNIVSYSPDRERFAVVGNTQTLGDVLADSPSFQVKRLAYISIWDVRTLTERRFQTHSDEGYSVAFSPCGGFLASTGADGVTRLWDAEDHSLCGTLAGHDSAVYAVAFSQGGRFIVTGGEDSSIQVYDTLLAYLGRGKRRIDSGRAIPAIADLNKAIRSCRGGRSQRDGRLHAEPFFERAKGRLLLGDLARASFDFERAIRGDEYFADCCRSHGNELFNRGRFSEAEACFTSVIEASRLQRSKDFGDRGMCKLRRRAFRSAVDDFTAAIRFEDDALSVYHEYRGVAHHRNAHFDEAIRDFSRAIEYSRPDENRDAYITLLLRRVRACLESQRPDPAIRDCTEALHLGPSERQRIEILRLRGRASHQAGDYISAIDDFTSALGHLGEHSDVEVSDQLRPLLHLDRGRSLAGSTRYGRAIGEYELVISFQPSERMQAEAYCAIGEARYEIQDFYGAIRDYSRVIKIAPKIPHAFDGRAIVYWRLGQDDRAAQDQHEAKRLRQGRARNP